MNEKMKRNLIPWLTIPIIISFCSAIITFLRLSTLISGRDGIKCFDKNQNGMCDIRLEDVNRDGVCDYYDCFGMRGIDGIDGMNGSICWDINGDYLCDLILEDLNHDGNCTLEDCSIAINGTKCFESDDIIVLYQNVTDCKGEDANFTMTITPFCWDKNNNFIPDLPAEDSNNDTYVTSLDCFGNKGLKCWDANSDNICSISEGGSDGCSIYDCPGLIGESGDTCWDLDGDHFCDFNEAFLGNGDGICDSSDCYGFHCWDLNQNRLCDAFEDITNDTLCNLDDCMTTPGYVSSDRNIPNTMLFRYEFGAIEATDVYVENLFFTEELVLTNNISLPSTIYANVVKPNINFAPFTTIFSSNGNVIIDDEMVVKLTLYINNTQIKPRTGTNITLYGNIISQSNVSVTTIYSSDGLINVNTGNYYFGNTKTIRLTNLTSPTSMNLTSSQSIVIQGDFRFFNRSFYVVTNNIGAVDRVVTINRNRTTVFKIETFFAGSGYLRSSVISSYRYVEGFPLTTLYIWANIVGIIGSPIGSGILRVGLEGIYCSCGNGPVPINALNTITPTIYANSSSLYLVVNSNNSVNVISPNRFRTNIFSSISGDLNFVNMSIGDELKTDSIDKYTTISTTTIMNGMFLANSVSGYVPYKLDYYEIRMITLSLSGIYASPLDISTQLKRIGPKVSISFRSQARFTSVAISRIFVSAIPIEFRPSIDYIFPNIVVYNNNNIEFNGVAELFTNGSMIISASFSPSQRLFSASLNQNGFPPFTLEYII